MNKYFSPYFFSVLVGSVIVALLAGWYAFAFTGPGQPPPSCTSGAVGCDAPIHVGSALQYKAGVLQVDNFRSFLDVVVDGGYLQIDTTSGAPSSSDCNEASEEGRMIFDPGPDTLYVCSGSSGWVPK